MRKILIIILLFITTVGYGQIFETTLTQVDLYQGSNFETLISTQTINYNFTLDNTNNKVSISNSTTDLFVFNITNKNKVDYEGNDFLVMDLINVNTTQTSRMIVVDKPLKINTMQLLINFDNNRSLIFDTNLILD